MRTTTTKTIRPTAPNPNLKTSAINLRLEDMPNENKFGFSSRRRHTRFDCDWSSDVCSSDLFMFGLTGKVGIAKRFGSHLQAMSLIPSESYSFPDHFTRTVTPSRRPKNEQPEAIPVETRQKRPSIVALPSPRPQPSPAASSEDSETVRPKPNIPLPNPALRRASAPPPRIPDAPVRKIGLPSSLKPKVRWNMRAAAMDPAPVASHDREQISNEAPALPAQN